MSQLQQELKQSQPFGSVAVEAFLNLVRTAELARGAEQDLLDRFDLSAPQYNVLRILRGAGAAGLPTLAIRDRMIDEGSTVTRLLDKLEKAGLVVRDRSRPDRRQVLCNITPAGEALLSLLDPLMDAVDDDIMAPLSEDQQHTLIETLGALRTGG